MFINKFIAQLDTGGLPHHGLVGDGDLHNILGIVFALAASVSFLVIVIGGFRYIVAHGDPNNVARAKMAILYAVIGLLVSLAAFSIVTFVLKGVS
ncbi:MAG: hypothetical protein ABI220_00480 [Candidatus Saccharimonadales bacterium]